MESYLKKTCNILIETIKEKKMSFNYGKSGFLIINPSYKDDIRCGMKLDDGWFTVSCQKYLGILHH